MTRRNRWVWAVIAIAVVAVVGPCVATVYQGRPTIRRLEALLDRKPPVDEVTAFLERNRLAHSVTDRVIYAKIDVFGVFDSSKCYRIYFDADRRVTHYDADLEVVAP